VTAVENHFPEAARACRPHRSLSYRINSKGKKRSIIFSADTHYPKNLVGLAQGADILVNEMMAQRVVGYTAYHVYFNVYTLYYPAFPLDVRGSIF